MIYVLVKDLLSAVWSDLFFYDTRVKDGVSYTLVEQKERLVSTGL